MNFTENQQKAIDDKSGTLLISAGAGSGKTAVLTARLCKRICDPSFGRDISEYLIVTFTKAATLELHERLTKALTDAVAQDPSNKHALRQLTRIGLAKICTIHSFCLDLVKSNFQLLGLPAKLRMADEAESEILCRNILDNILEDKYSSSASENGGDDDAFLKAAQVFSGARSDASFAQILIDLYKFLRTLTNPFLYLDRCIQMYDEVSENDNFLDTEFGKMCVAAASFEIENAADALNEAVLQMDIAADVYEAYAETFEKEAEAMKDFCAVVGCKSYEEVQKSLNGVERSRLRPIRGCSDEDLKKQVQNSRTKAWKDFSEATQRYFGARVECVQNAAHECSLILGEMKQILVRLDAEYSASKAEKGILDYSDLEHMALSLLVDYSGEVPLRTELAKKFAEGIAEIYIDEYQDVNPLQDEIFRAICSYRICQGSDAETECNRFLVGDLKQSIYRFRGAKPGIFSDYIKNYPHIDSSDSQKTSAHKLYLSNNFRCSENVIDLTNYVFSRLMSDYDKADNLIYSKNESKKTTAPCEIIAVLPSISDANDVENNDSESSQSGEELDAEALFTAQKIKEIVGNPKFTDSDGNLYEYRDIAILARSANTLSKSYRRAFELCGVPLTSDAPDDFFSKPEVLLALCLFNTVDNPERDIYTAGLMRSKLFFFSDDELTEIRMSSRSTSFWGCVCTYGEQNKDCELGKKVLGFVERINSYRAMSRGMSTDRLITYLYDDTGLLNIIAAESSDKKENLITLYEYARSYEKTSFRGLSAYLGFLEDMNSVGKSARAPSSENAVTLMSIHRSKGLEFPICFVTALGKKFNTEDERTPLVKSDSNGVGLKLKNFPGNTFYPTDNGYVSVETPFRRAIMFAERTDMLEEEKRLLYVAMTRAKERLYLVGGGRACLKAIEKCDIARCGGSVKSVINHADNCMTWLLALCPDDVFNSICGGVVYDPDEPAINNKMLVGYVATPVINQGEERRKSDTQKNVNGDLVSQDAVDEALGYIREIIDFRYDSSCSLIPAKLSVSNLKYGLMDELGKDETEPETEIKQMPDFMKNAIDAAGATGAERGTALHVFMQFCNFSECAAGYIESEANRLCEQKFITKRQLSLLNYKRIERFFNGIFYKNVISNAKRVYRERRFNLSVPTSDFGHNTENSEDFVLVQGVIDCFCLNDDGTYTLIDFKTDAVSGENAELTLIERHRFQMEFYKRAIEEMTGGTVRNSYIYSFALNKAIPLT